MESSFHMALLVEVDNAAARRPYERLGFRTPSRGSTTSALIEQLKDEDFSPPFEFPYPIDFFCGTIGDFFVSMVQSDGSSPAYMPAILMPILLLGAAGDGLVSPFTTS
jgi:hypothetical protein